MKPEPRVVDNRVFLLGLDDLYREAMKEHERDELLRCAQNTANVLSIGPADVPIEGYYAEDEQLTEYFRLVRALQCVPKNRESEVDTVEAYQRLKEVTQSPIFGPPSDGQYLLSVGKDSLSVALQSTFPEWTIDYLTNTAYRCALDSGDFSLVALAALSRNAVVLGALRESVVLYAMSVAGCAAEREEPEYVWAVDDVVQSRATAFVKAFNELLDESLPDPVPENAELFWAACDLWAIIGRCVCLGYDDTVEPIRHYHWAIDRDDEYNPVVKDFWDTDIWTTQRYREQQRSD